MREILTFCVISVLIASPGSSYSTMFLASSATRENDWTLAPRTLVIPPLNVDAEELSTNGASAYNNNRRTLGFVVPSTRVDTDLWDRGQPLDIESSTAAPSSTDNKLSQFPWVPTREQIQGLSLKECRLACRQRGLVASHRSSRTRLQQELVAWAASQPQLDSQASIWKPDAMMGSDVPSSLAEWARTHDVSQLRQRRRDIKQKKSKETSAVTSPTTMTPSSLRNLFQQTTKYSNKQVSKLYQAAKHADQEGDPELSRAILYELLQTMSHDARIYRRLARLEVQQFSNPSQARAILQEGLRQHPRNGYLWHALGNLLGDKRCYRKAIQVDPSLAFSYHTLGTLEHAEGHIAVAMRVLTQGIAACPDNHRLHHALGDLYRDAKLLDMARKSYRKALSLSPAVSQGFALQGLAHVAYEQNQIDVCRRLLRKTILVNQGRFSNGWKALAQMEEAESNVEAARAACVAGSAQYEHGLLTGGRKGATLSPTTDKVFLQDVEALKMKLLSSNVPRYRSGDRFFCLYRNWLRLEERYGSPASVEQVYERASAVYPDNYQLALDVADYYAQRQQYDRARMMLVSACTKAGATDTEPYCRYARLEMSLGQDAAARKILSRGASILANRSLGGESYSSLVELYVTWSLCEWRLGHASHAMSLLERALQLTDEDDDQEVRAAVYFFMARQWYGRQDYLLAQHYIALSLGEFRAQAAPVWRLWSRVARVSDQPQLAAECERQVMETEDDLSVVSVQQHLRRDPWHDKLFPDERKGPWWTKFDDLWVEQIKVVDTE